MAKNILNRGQIRRQELARVKAQKNKLYIDNIIAARLAPGTRRYYSGLDDFGKKTYKLKKSYIKFNSCIKYIEIPIHFSDSHRF